MRLIDRLERRFKKFAIPSLITKLAYIYSALYIAMFIFSRVRPEVYYGTLRFMALDFSRVMSGEIWRLVTFVFIPWAPSILTTLFLAFMVFFMIFIGNTLENYWGTFKLNLYFFTVVLSVIIASAVTGAVIYSTNDIYMSLFLACAFIAPNYTIHLYGILPVKLKYLAYLDFFFIFVTLISRNPLGVKVVAIAPLFAYFLFFYKDIYHLAINGFRSHNHRRKHQHKVFHEGYEKPKVLHKCEVCGVTDVDDPNMEFRYCSKCNGLHEYCIKHIKDHQHK